MEKRERDKSRKIPCYQEGKIKRQMDIKRVKDRGGFALLEVLIASSTFVVVSGAIISLFIYGSNLWQLISTQNELRSGASTAIYHMTKELRNATYISTQTPSPNLTIPPKPNNNSVRFFLPTASRINTDGTTDWDTTLNHDIQYQYIFASKQLRRSRAGILKTICDNVASIEFENSIINPVLRNDELKVILKVEKNTLMGIRSTTVTSIIKLRN